MNTPYLIVVGIDPHRDFYALCAKDEDRRTLARAQFPRSAAGHAHCLRWLQALGVLPEQILIVLEAAGVYWLALYRQLHQAGFPVHVGTPSAIKWHARSRLLRSKTDAIDAAVMADYGWTAHPVPTIISDDLRFHALHELVGARDALVRDRARVKNRLQRCPFAESPREVRQVHTRLWRTLTTHIQKLERQIQQLLQALGGHVLQTIPGVGLTTAAAFTALIQDPRRFPSDKQSLAYIGLAPKIEQSGAALPKVTLSKMGNRRMRKYLHMATVVALNCNPDVKAAHEHALARGKSKKLAFCYALFKLTRILFGTWKKHFPQVYSPPTPPSSPHLHHQPSGGAA